MSLLGMKGGTGIGTDPRFLGSIWTQIWTWLDSNPVIGVEIFTKYAGILFTYYIIILGGGGGSRAMMILMTQGGGGGSRTGQKLMM